MRSRLVCGPHRGRIPARGRGPVTHAVAALVVALLWTSAGGLSAQARPFDGTADLRIEQEDKLLVPLDQAEEVWRFLHSWLVEDAEALASRDRELSARASEELFSDTYFDTPALAVLGRDDGVRYRHRLNLTDPTDPKHGRSLIQVKLNDISEDALERGEYKFDPDEPVDLSLPLLAIVQRSEREALRARLVEMGLDPVDMRAIFTIRDLRRRIYISRGVTPFLSVSHDHVTVRKLWASVEFVEIEPELNEVAYTAADSATRAYMAGIGKRISDEILRRFPDVRRDLTPKYGKATAALERSIPGFRTLVRFGLHDADGVAAVLVIGLGLVGALGVALIRALGRLRPAEPRVPAGTADWA